MHVIQTQVVGGDLFHLVLMHLLRPLVRTQVTWVYIIKQIKSMWMVTDFDCNPCVLVQLSKVWSPLFGVLSHSTFSHSDHVKREDVLLKK